MEQNKKVLVDGIHSKQIDPYKSVDTNTLNKIINGVDPFDHLDLLLFTHYHYDHLCIKSTIRTLKNQPNLKLFSTDQAIEAIMNDQDYHISLRKQIFRSDTALNQVKQFNINNIEFMAISTEHDGKQFTDVENYSYVLNIDGQNIFHCGDAKASTSNYENFTASVDVALLNFPYIALPEGRRLIENYLKPKQIVIMHLPAQEKDVYKWTDTLYKVMNRYKDRLPEIIVKQ